MRLKTKRLATVLAAMLLAGTAQAIPADTCDCPPKAKQTVVTVCVDYTRTLAQLITDGNYDWVNRHITDENFPSPIGQGAVRVDLILLEYPASMTSRQVLADMDREGLRPATVWELLSLGVQRKELPENETIIVALGMVVEVDGPRRVAYLGRSDRARYLRLDWFDSDWGGGCRCAAVRK